MDGSWEYVGERYGWKAGTWVVVPNGLRRARWLLVRRAEDGQLFFAPSTWKDASGNTVDDAAWIHALGPAARARTRLGGAPEYIRPPDEPPPASTPSPGPGPASRPAAAAPSQEPGPAAPEMR